MKTDLLKKELQVGDYVFVTRKNYRDLVVARVTSFTPKQIRVVYPASWSNNSVEEYLTDQVIKISSADLVNIKPMTRERVDWAFNQLQVA